MWDVQRIQRKRKEEVAQNGRRTNFLAILSERGNRKEVKRFPLELIWTVGNVSMGGRKRSI